MTTKWQALSETSDFQASSQRGILQGIPQGMLSALEFNDHTARSQGSSRLQNDDSSVDSDQPRCAASWGCHGSSALQLNISSHKAALRTGFASKARDHCLRSSCHRVRGGGRVGRTKQQTSYKESIFMPPIAKAQHHTTTLRPCVTALYPMNTGVSGPRPRHKQLKHDHAQS